MNIRFMQKEQRGCCLTRCCVSPWKQPLDEASDKLTPSQDGCGGFALDVGYVSCPCRGKVYWQMQLLENLFGIPWVH